MTWQETYSMLLQSNRVTTDSHRTTDVRVNRSELRSANSATGTTLSHTSARSRDRAALMEFREVCLAPVRVLRRSLRDGLFSVIRRVLATDDGRAMVTASARGLLYGRPTA